MNKLFRCGSPKFLLLLSLAICVLTTAAQTSSGLKIPKIDTSFFKGKVPARSKYASMTYLDYRYDFSIERSVRTSKVRVKVRMYVEANGNKSYLDRSRLNQTSLKNLVGHEQGHIDIGYYIAYQIEKELNAVSYTIDYRSEIRQNYMKAYTYYEKLQLAYDDETEHGSDVEAQTRWNRKIAELKARIS